MLWEIAGMVTTFVRYINAGIYYFLAVILNHEVSKCRKLPVFERTL